MTAFSALYFSSIPSCPQLLKSPPKSLIEPHLACLSLPRSKLINVVGRSSAFRPKMVSTPGPGSDIEPLRFSLAFGASISKREKFSPVSGEEKETRFEIDISTPLLVAPKQSNSLQSQTFCELFPSVLIHCAAIVSFIELLRNTIISNNSGGGGGGGGNIGGRGGEHSVKTESPTCGVSLDLRIRSNPLQFITLDLLCSCETVLAPSAKPLDPLDFETSGFKEKIIPGHDEALEAADNGAPTSHGLLGTSYRTQFMEPSKSVLK
ncbi:hypothetical protein POTOM_058469 [Populus tomentosa]|uniref:Uncharacterized protein n=1 Tax=Populus tomentosa TaxID=118781 RepID=A0A8X8BX15_POPTO|nr:hypothetical protein POTOM_058469 [Populus tomentosa]